LAGRANKGGGIYRISFGVTQIAGNAVEAFGKRSFVRISNIISNRASNSGFV